jgi:hypothetical protein
LRYELRRILTFLKLSNDLTGMHRFDYLFCSKLPLLRPRLALTVALLAVAGIGAVQQAEARHRGYRHYYRAERKAEAPAPEEKKPLGPLFAIVSLADQHVSFYDANGLWARSIISTGVPGHPTPTGIFPILEKERWHRSNIYSGAPMPFMQRLAWTGVAMHEGVVTGQPASHGCIRLPGAFAKRMFGVTNVGQRVIISPQDVSPTDIVNAHLPAPRLLTPPESPDDRSAASKPGAAVETVALDNPAKASPRTLNPGEYAQALKAAAAAQSSHAEKARKAALASVDGKAAEARQAAKDLAAAEESLRRAKEELDDASRDAGKAQGDEAIKKAGERKSAAEEKLAAAEAKAREARDAKAAKDQDQAAVEKAIRDADAERETAAANAKDATTRLEPISIFISRKTGRLYVRQATQHLFDVPITIRDPGRPIGSHLFVAMRAGEDGSSLRWTAVTPPAAVEVKLRPHSSRRGRRFEPEPEEPQPALFPETAAAALDRIEIPPEAAQRIADRLWVGATLIISDVGMSGEGRYAMDFMILGRTAVRED